jgi:hypothetical protein
MGGNRVRITAKLIETEAVFGPTASTAHWRTYSICSRQTSSVALQTPRISLGQPTPLAQESKMTEMHGSGHSADCGFLVNLGLLCSRTECKTGGLHASVHGARNEVAQNERGVDPHS